MKNRLLQWATRLIRPFLKTHPQKNRILIVSTTALGDTLWATPAIENIRNTFPKAYIAVLTSPIGMQVLKHNPYIDQLYLLKKPFSLWKRLYAEQFDTILLLHASQRFTLPLISILGATRIIGTKGINKGLDSLLTHPLCNHHLHEIVRRLEIAETIGAKTTSQTLSFFLKPNEISPLEKKRPLIALHPGSKDPFKRWPKEKFIELGCNLKAKLSCDIVITGTKDELKLMKEIQEQIPDASLYPPNCSLRQFASYLTQVDLLISNDTGPVHLASALNRPTIALYASTNPAQCGPHHAPNTSAIFKPPTCTPCAKRKCLQPFCFLQISSNEVFEKAMQKIN
ncbi:MAG: hypothetical protein COT85_06585 [Chlamydiae bacterium CG10_big_fil_rev_8_21_14_0_10_42_34]|nr:MAG: hypothetical protein COT85_06585 [Chlamydiae bacterium CG10_big_fil_rev_8_21_14_0_10_42_34]